MAREEFEKDLEIKADHNVVPAGCIQYFEFTSELAWKSVKAVAEVEGIDPGGSPKSCLKTAFAQIWIDNETTWLEILEASNRMSHTYDAKDALVIYERLGAFTKPMTKQLTTLGTP